MATVYVVLRSEPEADSYAPIGEFEAGNWDAAVTGFLNEEVKPGELRGEQFGEADYKAVPKRSWPEEPRPIRKKISFA